MKREALLEVFHLPLEEAGKRLGVGTTALSRICREFNVKRWPYRKVHAKIRKVKKEKEDALLCSIKNAPTFAYLVEDKEPQEISRSVILSTLSSQKHHWENRNSSIEREPAEINGLQGNGVPPDLNQADSLGPSELFNLVNMEAAGMAEDYSAELARNIQGLIGLDNSNDASTFNWLLNFFEVSMELQNFIGDFVAHAQGGS